MLVLIYFALFIAQILSQKCLNAAGTQIDWWVKFKLPGSVGAGYGYFDSTMKTSVVALHSQKVDYPDTALYRTLNQINTLKLQALAWNDEMPNGTTTSTKAHSKVVIGILPSSSNGFFIDHSIPKYPEFIGTTVNITVNDSQNVYGQHILCMSLALTTIESIAQKLLLIKPNIYHTSITNTANTTHIYTLSLNTYNTSTTGLDYLAFTIGASTSVRSIYKNGNVNNSLYEDGLNNYLQQEVIAETWGRPLQPSWCGKYPVINALTVGFSGLSWKQTQDHSKWAFGATKWGCFGDLNRMTSQFKRGGAYYCLDSDILNKLMNSITLTKEVCCPQKSKYIRTN